MDKRYQVFISSTFRDLLDERQAVLKSILMLDHMPAGMELFPATDDAAWQLICDVIDASDYYVLLLGGRYGSLDEEGIGFTEKEYRYAHEKGIPVVPFLHANPDNLPRGKTEKDPAAWRKLVQFRKFIEDNHTCMYWNSVNELQGLVALGLTATVKRRPMQGWIRAGAMASDEATQKILSLQSQVADLSAELDRLGTTPPAGVENLAQGEDLMEVEFKVSYASRERQYGIPEERRRERFSAKVTWDDIFAAIAPNLTEPQKASKVRADIARYLRDAFEEEVQSKQPDFVVSSATIGETLFNNIRIQLEALGLIESRIGMVKNAQGAEREVRYCELTKFGRGELIRICAIHKN